MHSGNSPELQRFLFYKKVVHCSIVKLRPIESCKEMFAGMRILTMTSLYKYGVCRLVYKNREFFESERVQRTSDSRNKQRLVPPKHTSLYQKGIYYNGCS